MSMPINELFEDCAQAQYPGEFLKDYEPLECLALKPESETLFVKDRRSGVFAVAKCYRDKSLISRDSEASILRSLKHENLPRFLGEYENNAMLCVVREYIKGIPLNELGEQGLFTQEETLQVAMQLCDTLTCLHSQKPPVIHRDIKPQNIIITDEGTAKLIDFGIARTYHADAAKDTVFYGTQEFAPPEQYGYAQTDCRSDLFSLGVVIGYMLTGQTDLQLAARAIKNKRLARIYRICTDFNPKKRFSSASKLKAALLKADGKRQKATLKLLIPALACLIFLLTGFLIGRNTDVFSPKAADLVFKEPMIEQAVRLQLNKAENDALTEKDLLAVSELYIFGDSVIAATEHEMDSASDALFAANAMRRGPIQSVDDLVKLPNLRRVALAMQEIHYLDPLTSLTSLEVIILKNNPISDISPLFGLPRLQRLSVFDTRVSDFSGLASCPKLQDLDAGGTPISTPDAFAGLKNLSHLMLCKHTLKSLDGIGQLTNLRSLMLGNVIDADLSPLLALPKLETLAVDPALREAAALIADEARFTINIP